MSGSGKIALVTGGGSGVGREAALALAAAGYSVVIAGRRKDALDETIKLAEGGRIAGVATDVTDPAAVDAAVAAIEAEVGPIDILVNNAGITRRAAFTDISDADWRAVLQTNLDAAFYAGRAVARRMVARKRGRIVNTCSVMSELARPSTAPYAASKGALKMLTKAMAVELAPHGITVNGIAPGYFETELTAPLVADEAFNRWVISRTPARRWGNVEELAPALVFLCSDGAAYVNGHLLLVDGGMTAAV